MQISKLDPQQNSPWNDRLIQLEASISYPLGDDRFHLDHGSDYFAFFRRLGVVHCYLAHHDERILGLGQGILRSMPDGKRAWYLCDLKVIPEARGHKLTYRLFRRAFFWNYLKCSRGYAITMDPPQGENPIVRLSEHLPFTPLQVAARLAFFSLSYSEMQAVRPHLESHRGPVSFLSHRGRKDLIMQSTGKAMPLWHAQWGAFAEREKLEPVEGGTHMFTVPMTDPLFEELLSRGLRPSAHAHVLAHRMKHTNWAFVLSSDI